MTRKQSNRRRAAAIPVVAATGVLLFGAAALTVDMGLLHRARQESQTAADAAALAAAWELLDEDRLRGSFNMSEEIAAARQVAVEYASRNPVMNASPQLDPNTDVVVGYLNDITNLNDAFDFSDPSQFNTVQVRVHGPVALTFASLLGHSSSNVAAVAAATFKDGVEGFRVTPQTGNAGLLPLALHVDVWEGLLDGTWPSTDNWSYIEDSESVAAGPDEIPEVNLYPGAGANQLPPGNCGTVDIGSANNSTAVIARQILHGITAEDLAYHGGELVLGADGTLELQGDTGLSAGIADELETIIGEPRTIVLFNHVESPGNNAVYTIVGFAGVRIMDVRLTGPMHTKRVIIQPAFVVDDAALTSAGSGSSYFVYQPVILVR